MKKKFIFCLLLCLFIQVNAKEITLNEYENELKIERSYIVCNHVFDLTNGYNPSLKDLLVAASYCDIDKVSVYEIKISENINGDIIREYNDLLNNESLSTFPSIDIKYIYYNNISSDDFKDIDNNKTLSYKSSNTKELLEDSYNNLNIERAYILGEYVFNLDNGFNPSLLDLLMASTTTYTNDITVYEIKKSENINGDIITEYSDLLSFHNIERFPSFKTKYVYSKHIVNNNPDLIIKSDDIITVLEKNVIYTGEKVSVNKGTNISGSKIIYTYYENDDCTGNILLDAPSNAGNYSVKLHSDGNSEYNETDLCIKHTINKSNTSTTIEEIIRDIDENIDISEKVNSVLLSNSQNISNGSYEFNYYEDNLCENRIDLPESFGNYYVKATLKDNQNYHSSSSDCTSYTILKPSEVSISALNNVSLGNLLTVSRDTSEVTMQADTKVWSNKMEYNDEDIRGNSRFTIKVNKDFIGDEDTYYDVIIDYYDEGNGIVIMQSSQEENNDINYSKYNYGGYVEDFPIWQNRIFSLKNLTFSLTNTNEWKRYTFNVTNKFFDKDLDNYIHFYFGQEKEGSIKNVKVSKITIVKRVFKVDTIDSNGNNVIGNIYTKDNFGMGFSINNTSSLSKKIKLSYEIVDVNKNKIYENNLGEVNFNSNEKKDYYLDYFNTLDLYGSFRLIVTIEYNGTIEKEEIRFSKIFNDLTGERNDILALNANYGYSGWYSTNIAKKTLNLSSKLGVYQIRQGINDVFLQSDILNGYTNRLGRYQDTFDSLIKINHQDVLPIIWNTYTDISLDSNGLLTDESFISLKEEIVEYYKRFALEYGDYFEYYEMLNEWNNGSPYNAVTPEQYAEIVVEVSKEIRKIDSDAKIVALTSHDDIWRYKNDCSYYSPSETSHQHFSEDSWVARVLKTKWKDDNNVEKSFLSYVDVVAIHLYPYYVEKTIEDNYYYERMNEVRKIIEYYNDESKNIPIWFTETGLYTLYDGKNEEVQASNIVKTLIFSQANQGTEDINDFHPLNIDKVYLFALQDTSEYVFDGEANYGIVSTFKDNNVRPFTRSVEMYAKASYVAVNMFSNILNNYKLIDTNLNYENINDYNIFYKFKKDEKIVIATWNLSEEESNVELNIENVNGKIADIYDIYGNKLDSITIKDNLIKLDVSEIPKYIVIS